MIVISARVMRNPGFLTRQNAAALVAALTFELHQLQTTACRVSSVND